MLPSVPPAVAARRSHQANNGQDRCCKKNGKQRDRHPEFRHTHAREAAPPKVVAFPGHEHCGVHCLIQDTKPSPPDEPCPLLLGIVHYPDVRLKTMPHDYAGHQKEQRRNASCEPAEHPVNSSLRRTARVRTAAIAPLTGEASNTAQTAQDRAYGGHVPAPGGGFGGKVGGTPPGAGTSGNPSPPAPGPMVLQ